MSTILLKPLVKKFEALAKKLKLKSGPTVNFFNITINNESDKALFEQRVLETVSRAITGESEGDDNETN